MKSRRGDLLQKIAGEVTGYPAADLRGEHRWQADLGVSRSQLAAIAERLTCVLSLDASVGPRLLASGTLGGWRELSGLEDPGTWASDEDQGQAAASAGDGVQAPRTEAAVIENLLRIAAEKTGYEPSQLDLDADLEADLGIDSIKQAQIAGRLRTVYSMTWAPGMRIRDFRTLRHWVRFVLSQETTGLGEIACRADRLVPFLEASASLGAQEALPAPVFWIVSNSADTEGVARELSGRLAAGGARAQVLESGQSEGAAGTEPLGVVYLGALGREPASKSALECLRWTRAAGLGRLRCFIAATELGGDFGLADLKAGPAAEAGGAVGGFVKALGAECPGVHARVVDFEPGQALRDPRAVAQALLDEIRGPSSEREIGYRDGTRSALRWKAEALGLLGPRQLKLASRPVVAFVGGAQGIGAEIALDLARREQARLVLLGRTAEDSLPPDAQERIAQMREAGAQVEYVRCDVTDLAATERVMDAIRERHGRIDGVVHSGGIIEDRKIEEKSDASFERVYAVKATGLDALARAVLKHRPAFFCVFGSVSGRFGNEGQCDYAAGNEAACKMMTALRAERPGLHAFSIAWGAWEGAGMAERSGVAGVLKAGGQGALSLQEGVAAFRAELLYGTRAEVIVRSAPVPKAAPEAATAEQGTSAVPGFPLLSRIRSQEPGVWLEAALDLRLSRDEWLRDHRFSGQVVFPATVGIEMMVQGALALFPGFSLSGLDELKILRPIHVGETASACIELRADARPGTLEEDREVAVQLSVEGGVCYETVILLRALSGHEPVPQRRFSQARPAGWLSSEQLYPLLLPLGPAFHVLDGFDPLSGTGRIRATALAALSSDPQLLAREAAFHAAALLTLAQGGDALVPRSIRRMRVHAQASAAPGPLCVSAAHRGSGFDLVVAHESGPVVCEISGFDAIGVGHLGGLS